jgi:hypothetical protein
MMNELALWSSLGGVIVALVAMVKFWMDMGATKRDASDALKKAEDAEKGLSQFKTDVAKDYVQMQALYASEKRLADAIADMRTDVRSAVGDLTTRIDQILSLFLKPQSHNRDDR